MVFSSINGNPGIINYIETKPQSVLSFNFQVSDDDILIQNIFAVLNPEKLKLVILKYYILLGTRLPKKKPF